MCVCIQAWSCTRRHGKFVSSQSLNSSTGYVLQRLWMASETFIPLIKGQPSRRTPCLLAKRFCKEMSVTMAICVQSTMTPQQLVNELSDLVQSPEVLEQQRKTHFAWSECHTCMYNTLLVLVTCATWRKFLLCAKVLCVLSTPLFLKTTVYKLMMPYHNIFLNFLIRGYLMDLVDLLVPRVLALHGVS